MENLKKDCKIVFNSGVARKLLKMGAQIVDVKPDRSNAETGKDKTLFVFKRDEAFEKAFAEINEELRNKEE